MKLRVVARQKLKKRYDMPAKSTATAGALLIAAAATATRAIDQTGVTISMISTSEVSSAAVGGLVGGWLLSNVTKLRDPIDVGAAVALSGGIGGLMGPALARTVEVNVRGLSVGDPFVAGCAGEVIGMLLPPVFAVVVAILSAARDNPASFGDFISKLMKK